MKLLALCLPPKCDFPFPTEVGAALVKGWAGAGFLHCQEGSGLGPKWGVWGGQKGGWADSFHLLTMAHAPAPPRPSTDVSELLCSFTLVTIPVTQRRDCPPFKAMPRLERKGSSVPLRRPLPLPRLLYTHTNACLQTEAHSGPQNKTPV